METISHHYPRGNLDGITGRIIRLGQSKVKLLNSPRTHSIICFGQSKVRLLNSPKTRLIICFVQSKVELTKNPLHLALDLVVWKGLASLVFLNNLRFFVDFLKNKLSKQVFLGWRHPQINASRPMLYL